MIDNSLKLSSLSMIAAASLFLVACAVQITESRSDPSSPLILPEIVDDVVNGMVINVVDGVTIEVDIDGQIHTIKYLGLELPNDNQLNDNSALYRQGLEFNRFLVQGRPVQLVKGPVETDSFGRLLRYVYVDGELANETLITNGYATVGDFPQSFKFQTAFLLAEEYAKKNLRGIWENSQNIHDDAPQSLNDSTEMPKFGGTLPTLPSASENTQECDFSGTSTSVIKAVVQQSGDRIFYLPNNTLYSSIVVDESQGDTFFCTEFEALLAGWSKPNNN